MTRSSDIHPAFQKIEDSLGLVLTDLVNERYSQDRRWGQQNHSDGTGTVEDAVYAWAYRELCNERFQAEIGTWRDILLEEVYEALAEKAPAKLREELVQVGAVVVAWVEALDRRAARYAERVGYEDGVSP